MLYVADNALYDGERCLDAAQLVWAPASLPKEHRKVTDYEAVHWLQKESGTPIRPPVAVIGPREASKQEMAVAYDLGQYLARLGMTVLCGGRQGVMESVCRGVHESGGLSVGLLPDGEWQSANPYVTVPIATGIGIARNTLIARAALCVVAVGGGLGTLSEIALSLQFGKKVFSLCHSPDVPGMVRVADIAQLEPKLCRAILQLD